MNNKKTAIPSTALMEHAHRRITEYYRILSKARRYKYHVFLDYSTLLGEKQPILFVYKNTGKYMFLQYCYPITKEQYQRLEKDNINGFKSKNMESGHRCYLDCFFAYASLEFKLDDGLDFTTAFGYLARLLEKHLKALGE